MQLKNIATSSAIGFSFNTPQKSFKDTNGITLAEFSNLDKKDQAKIEGAQGYTLTGYTKDQKVSIWGKLMGYDSDFGSDKINELKKFIDESGGLGIEHLPTLNKNGFSNKLNFVRDDFFSVDEFANEFNTSLASAILSNSKSISLLDSDLSIDEFKVKWAQNTLKERFGLTLKDDDASKAIDILNELQSEQELKDTNKAEQNEKFKPLEVIRGSQTYKDEAINELQKFYELVKREFDSGKNTFDILKAVAENKIDIKV